MQNDLISRSALLKDVEDWHDSLGGTMNPADWGIQNVLQSVMDNIIEAEGVDAAPVVHGRWNEPTGRFQDGFWVCSCCNFCTEAIAAVQLYKYCPNCGAKMDGVRKDDV